jgi:aminopeptidase
MSDHRTSNLARILVQYSTRVRPRELVAIYAQEPATPLVQELYREILRAGAYPYLLVRSRGLTLPGLEDLDYIFFSEATEDQLQHVDLFDKRVIEEFDVWIRVWAQLNTRSLADIAPSRLQRRTQAYAPLIDTWTKRAAEGGFRWTIAAYPSLAGAQDAKMSLEQFREYVFRTTLADAADPVAEWNGLAEAQERLVQWLAGKKRVEVKGPDIDLSFAIDGRKFVSCDGKLNMPDGEIFTGPVEDSVSGWARFAFPVIESGHEIVGAEIRLEEGKVVEASAEGGQEFLQSAIRTDPGASYIGEFGIGTNPNVDRFTGEMLFDEKMIGTIHLAVGNGYPETGSKNESSVHLDMLCDMRKGGEILVDGELFYRSGDFLV